MRRVIMVALAIALAGLPHGALSQSYALKEGDLVRISVWGEDALDRETRILLDGSISFPLVGSVKVAGLSTEGVENLLSERIAKYVSQPDISVEVRESSGNRIFVLGKVNSPGAFPLDTPLTVVQALALAGGLDTFADEKDVRIVRREDDKQTFLQVEYHRILAGRNLTTNYELMAGDTILVP